MSYISDTLQPARFGEIYSLFNTRLDGEVKWNSTAKTLQTRGLKIFTTPITGGGQAITLIPDGLYPMTSLGSALWIKLTRYSGSATALPVPYDSSQPTPSQDWIELAYRSDTNIINLFGGSIAGNGAFSRPGTSRGGGLYDAIVGPVSNPVATHTSIQTAIDDCLDGNRILILQGTYNIASPGNAGLDANSALAWSGKTLSIEGQGYGTVIVNTGTLTTAFFIKADATSKGTGSQIKNLKIQTFSKSAAFNGSLGAINDCSVDLYHYTATYTAPTITGSGDENFVKEWVMPSYKIIENRVRSGGLQTVTKENALTTMTGTVKLTSLTASQAVVTDASQQLASLAYSTATTGSTLVQRTSGGYINATYFNASADEVSSGVTRVAVETGSDNYYRWGTNASIASFLANTNMTLNQLTCSTFKSSSDSFSFQTLSNSISYRFWYGAVSATNAGPNSGCAVGLGIRDACVPQSTSVTWTTPPNPTRTAYYSPVFIDYQIGPHTNTINPDDYDSRINLAQDQAALNICVMNDTTGKLVRILSYKINLFGLLGGGGLGFSQGADAPIVGVGPRVYNLSPS